MATWIIYAVAGAAFVMPSLLALRYKGKISELQSDIKHLKAEYSQELTHMNNALRRLAEDYESYRDIVENSGSTPASIIDKLREAGKIA